MLPEKPPIAWQASLTSSGLGGVAANERYVLVGDRDLDDFQDVFRCFDARTGQALWQVQHLAIGKLDYGQSSRATLRR